MNRRSRHPWTRHAPVFLGLMSVLFPSVVCGAGGNELEQLARQASAAQIPMEKMGYPRRAKAQFVVQKAQIFERGKAEAFPCNPDVYRWLLESPDASLFAWKRLGATKASISRQPDGSFVGNDGMGAELRWELIATGPQARIWYGEGSGRMGPLLPTMTVRALVLLTFQEVKGVDGRTGIKQHLDLFAHYDSSPLISKLTGLSAESIGKKVMQQMEVFFSGMAWYASEHASWTKTTFGQWATSDENKTRLQPLLQIVEKSNSAAALPPMPKSK
jgi:hypothetical protein